MDAVEFLKARKRLCDSSKYCENCPLYIGTGTCQFTTSRESDECAVVSTVEQWAKEHPIKTRQSEFLKMFPEASVLYDEYLNICPAQISSECRDKKTGGCYDPGMDCGKCKRDFWLTEIKDGET